MILRKIWAALFVAVFSVSIALAQSVWQYSAYQNTTHKNFRQNPLFAQTFDFERIDYPLLHAAIFFVTNETRVKNQRQALAFAIELERAAYHHSKYNGWIRRDEYRYDFYPTRTCRNQNLPRGTKTRSLMNSWCLRVLVVKKIFAGMLVFLGLLF
jgi:hypothetical protein